MFAYCNNNPVNNNDSGGTSPISYCTGNGDRNPLFIGYYGCGGGGGGGGSFSCGYGSTREAKAIIQREKDYLTNTDEQVVLDADYIAFYKGKIIIKAPIGENAFSFGIIVMGNKVTDVDDVRHEYGHAVHMSQIGIGPYLITSAIPSLIGFWTGIEYDYYYSQPWEYIADYLGGVTRDDGAYNYAPWADSVAKYYWLTTLMIGMMP